MMDKCICRATAPPVNPAQAPRTERTMNALLHRLEALLPIRYSFMAACALGALLALFSLLASSFGWPALLVLLVCAGLVAARRWPPGL